MAEHRHRQERPAVGSRFLIYGAAGLLAIVILGAAAALWIAVEGFDEQAALRLLDENREWAGAILILLMIIHCFVPFPAEALALAAGAMFGVVAGTALIWIGAMLGAALSFALARRLGRPFVVAMLPERHVERLDGLREGDLATTLLISRFLPIIAFNLINYGAGLTPVRWTTFLWTTALGILPLTTLMVWMGAEMRSLSWTALGGLCLAGVVLVIGARFAVRGRA